jgi:glycosyltransferase involved in cell wall biosynthesis
MKCKYSLLIYDVYPEALIVGGFLREHSFISSVWRKLNSIALSMADQVITISGNMADMLRSHIQKDNRIDIIVIPNWTDTDSIKPIPKNENPIIDEFHLNGKFIVSYAGAYGATHGINTIIECADILKNYPHIHFLMLGGGTVEKDITRLVHDKCLSNIILLPFQPKERFWYMMAATDISIITQKPGGENVSLPSKVYTALAAGSMIIAATDKSSYLAAIVNTYRCGVVISPEDASVMADVILSMSKAPSLMVEYKKNARKTAETVYSKKIQCTKYRALFKDGLS